jgi:hypothetical protein
MILKIPKARSITAHNFLRQKNIFYGVYFETYWFNLTVVWAMTLLLYVALYFEWLKKLIGSLESLAKRFE